MVDVGEKEAYHTFDAYTRLGIDPFLAHAREYLAGQRTVPVCKPNRLDSFPEVTVTYSNALLQTFLDDYPKIKKPHDVTMRYGFRGYSTGEQNGIFLLRSGHDTGLFRGLESLIPKHLSQIGEDLNISPDKIEELQKVKIVWHKPDGERVLGVYNTGNHRMIFLDSGHY